MPRRRGLRPRLFATRGTLERDLAFAAERQVVIRTGNVKEATRSNAPGDFYVAKDECITCGAPEAEAPDLMDFDHGVRSCYFERQPSTPAEVEQAIRAVWVSCCRAVRYRGSDPEIQRRLIEHGDLQSIDVPVGRVGKGRAG